MVRSKYRRRMSIAVLTLFVVCGSVLKAQAPAGPAKSGSHPSGVAQSNPSTTVEDPVATLIAASERHFTAGQKELEQGHVDAAKVEFNRAVEVLVESPYGGRTEPRIREHFDRLVDRITAFEVRALATGD